MKLERGLLLIAMGILLGWGVGAGNEPVKMGFVDVDKVLATVEKGKAARDELERKSRDAQGRLQPMLDRLKTMEGELQSKQFVMSEEALKAKQLDIAELRNKLQNEAEKEKGQLEVEQQRITGPLIERLEAVIKEVGQNNGFAAIMATSAPGLHYHKEALDVTDLVVKTFNGKG